VGGAPYADYFGVPELGDPVAPPGVFGGASPELRDPGRGEEGQFDFLSDIFLNGAPPELTNLGRGEEGHRDIADFYLANVLATPPGLTREPLQINKNKTWTKAKGIRVACSQYHKTQLCTFFQKNRCKLGNNCAFAHEQAELNDLPDYIKTKLCYNFIRDRCTNANCKYAHGKDELRIGDSPNRAPNTVYWKKHNEEERASLH
jgi:hypothetical protein